MQLITVLTDHVLLHLMTVVGRVLADPIRASISDDAAASALADLPEALLSTSNGVTEYEG